MKIQPGAALKAAFFFAPAAGTDYMISRSTSLDEFVGPAHRSSPVSFLLDRSEVPEWIFWKAVGHSVGHRAKDAARVGCFERASAAANDAGDCQDGEGHGTGYLLVERTVRRLLRLAQEVSDVDSTFLISLSPGEQRHEILYSLNQKGPLKLEEGETLGWSEDCLHASFLAGLRECATDAQRPTFDGAEELGIKTFFALPVRLHGMEPAALCGVSQKRIRLDRRQFAAIRELADTAQPSRA